MARRKKTRSKAKNVRVLKTENQKLLSPGLIVGFVFVAVGALIGYYAYLRYFRKNASYTNISNTDLKAPNITPTVTQVPITDTPIPLPTSAPVIENINNQSVLDFIKRYYFFISSKQYNQAFNLLSNNFKWQRGGLNKFIAGYSTTVSTKLLESKVNGPNGVFVRIEASDLINGKTDLKIYSGTLWCIYENGSLKLNSSSLRLVEQKWKN